MITEAGDEYRRLLNKSMSILYFNHPMCFSEHFSCGALTFKCPGSYCIPLRRRCDEVNDCPGGEDEHDCGKDYPFDRQVIEISSEDEVKAILTHVARQVPISYVFHLNSIVQLSNKGNFDFTFERTSHSFNENQPMHRKRNFLKIFCNQI